MAPRYVLPIFPILVGLYPAAGSSFA